MENIAYHFYVFYVNISQIDENVNYSNGNSGKTYKSSCKFVDISNYLQLNQKWFNYFQQRHFAPCSVNVQICTKCSYIIQINELSAEQHLSRGQYAKRSFEKSHPFVFHNPVNYFMAKEMGSSSAKKRLMSYKTVAHWTNYLQRVFTEYFLKEKKNRNRCLIVIIYGSLNRTKGEITLKRNCWKRSLVLQNKKQTSDRIRWLKIQSFL